jgi:quercetin dioxygenase-like cupin family protein
MEIKGDYMSKSMRQGLMILGALVLSVAAWATPPFGFITNLIFASGFAPDGLSQHIQLNKNADGSVTPWQLQLQVQGETDYHSQHLALQPGGYSGWHSHPGLLIATVKSGQIDLYGPDCTKRTVTAGEVYTESDQVHAIVNNGTADADLYLSYLVKHGVPRRLEEPAPPCAAEVNVP